MQLQAVQYLPRKLIALDWRYLLRWFMLGPFTGACVGFVQMTAAVLVWVCHGEPDFYFRGWRGIKTLYVVWSFGGSMVGIAYGLALRTFERMSHRRIQLWIVCPSVIIVGFVAQLLVTMIEFEKHVCSEYVFLPEAIAIGFGLVISIATARPSLSQQLQ